MLTGEPTAILREKILHYLSQGVKAPREPIAPDTNLFDAGILDSFRLVEFVTFLETETGRSISDENLDDPRFTSVAGILEVLEGDGAVGGVREASGAR